MDCIKCGKRLKYLGIRHNGLDEIYRRYKCYDCNREVFTVEYEVEKTDQFIKQWKEAGRGK